MQGIDILLSIFFLISVSYFSLTTLNRQSPLAVLSPYMSCLESYLTSAPDIDESIPPSKLLSEEVELHNV